MVKTIVSKTVRLNGMTARAGQAAKKKTDGERNRNGRLPRTPESGTDGETNALSGQLASISIGSTISSMGRQY